MGIKPDPNKPGTWLAYHAKRHPITRKSVNLRRRNIKSKAEAVRIAYVLSVTLLKTGVIA